MKKLANQLKHDPSNTSLRENLYFVKRSYKNLIKKKKALYKKNIIDEMHLTKASDIKQFWKLLNKLDIDNIKAKSSVEEISPREWMNHYTNLFQCPSVGVIYWLTSLLVPIHKKGPTDDPDQGSPRGLGR